MPILKKYDNILNNVQSHINEKSRVEMQDIEEHHKDLVNKSSTTRICAKNCLLRLIF